MTLQQAIKKLSGLGFKMEIKNGCIKGEKGSEAFNYYPNEIISTPMRDVFVGETRSGWQVTSHINFRGKRKRHSETHYATILNIYGEGKTLEAAVDEFEGNFRRRDYRIYESIQREGVPTPHQGVAVSLPVGRGVDI